MINIEEYFKKSELLPVIVQEKRHRGSADAGLYESGKFQKDSGNRIYLVLQPLQTGIVE